MDTNEWIDFLPCSGTYEDLLATLSPNFRANLRKARNRLASAPGVEFRSYAGGPDLEWALAEFARIESSGWKATGEGTGILTRREGEERYHARARVLAALGGCRVNLLFVQGRAVAGQWGTVDRGTVFLFKIGYDEGCARLSPGNMMMEWLVRRCLEDPTIWRIDLTSATAWHQDWKAERYALSNVHHFNRTLRGRLAQLATLAKLRVKAMRARRRRDPAMPTSDPVGGRANAPKGASR